MIILATSIVCRCLLKPDYSLALGGFIMWKIARIIIHQMDDDGFERSN